MNTNNLERETPEGEQWIITKHTKVLHRKTFIKGKLVSKYYGELDDIKDAHGYVKEKYFDFTLYEAEIKESVFRMNNDGKFPEFKSSEIFPGIIQPSPLPCKIKYNNIEGDFEIVLYDLVLANIDFNKHRALHQEEDNQIFGTVEADITGYLLEKFIEEFETKALKPVNLPPTKEPIPVPKGDNSGDGGEEPIPPFPISEFIVNPVLPYYPTGRKEIKGDYIYDEETDGTLFRLVNPTYIGKKETGCVESFWQLIGLVMALLFLIAIGPQGILGLLIVTAFILFIVYFSLIIKWLIRIAAVLMLAFAVYSFIISLQNNKPIPTPIVKDEKRETDTAVKDKSNPSDSLIIHHRIWKDYGGTQYEGNIWVKLSDYKLSSYFKRNLYVQSNTMDVYDKMLFDLKNQDSSKLYGVYKLLDSIRLSNNQSDIRFAETVVSFIQDIPYAIVLDNACDANLYNDQFTKKYLKDNEGDCDGYQRFGINSPVEFMANLKGDCDTRTLLLYTMFSHYHYDVALLSSELYSHSILAINLPITGKYIIGNGKKYVVWETTSGVKPGLLPEEMSDFNNWRISLISKP